jgi:hypothetical protein
MMQTSIAGKASTAEKTIRCITERSGSISALFSEPCSRRPVGVSPSPSATMRSNMWLFHKSAAGALILGMTLSEVSQLVPTKLCGQNGQSANVVKAACRLSLRRAASKVALSRRGTFLLRPDSVKRGDLMLAHHYPSYNDISCCFHTF